MSLGNQKSGPLQGTTPLAYMGNIPNMVFNDRRPTPQDFDFNLGCWWILPNGPIGTKAPNPIQREIWVLVGKQQHLASWKRLHGSGTGPTVSGIINYQYFTTPGAGVYTPTEGMTQCVVECVGAGAGGNGNTASGGGYVRKLYTSDNIGISQPLFVGAGGSGNPGSNGEDTTFSSSSLLITAGGGRIGQVASTSVIGGSATGGDLNIVGGPGIFNNEVGGSGFALSGSSLLGFGAATVGSIPASGYGGAGGYVGPTADDWLAGSDGIIIITEYIS